MPFLSMLYVCLDLRCKEADIIVVDCHCDSTDTYDVPSHASLTGQGNRIRNQGRVFTHICRYDNCVFPIRLDDLIG